MDEYEADHPEPDEPFVPPGIRQRFLHDGETVVMAFRPHLASIWEPIASCLVGLVLLLLIMTILPTNAGALAQVLLAAWLALAARMVWFLFERHHTWIIATNVRLLMKRGFLNHNIPMMPLTKVTDMTYTEPILGRILGYGELVMESAGQDQALSSIRFIPHPKQNYQALTGAVFKLTGQKMRDRRGRIIGETAPIELDPEAQWDGSYDEGIDRDYGDRWSQERADAYRPAVEADYTEGADEDWTDYGEGVEVSRPSRRQDVEVSRPSRRQDVEATQEYPTIRPNDATGDRSIITGGTWPPGQGPITQQFDDPWRTRDR